MIDPSVAPLDLSDAVERILAQVSPATDDEEVPLHDALGRVLAVRVLARVNVPAVDNSAMDGYAIRVADVGETGRRLPVSQRIFAGAVGDGLAEGTAARIFTGAPVPEGADAVVPQEVCEVDGDFVFVPGPVPVGKNVRRAGEGARTGDAVLEPGGRIDPQALAIAASVGHGRLRTHRRPRVATFSTGDELRDPGDELGPGQIYDSNRAMLRGLLEGLGCEPVDLGRIPDDYARTVDVLREAAGGVDAIVTSGGVSVGEADHVHTAAAELGELNFWRVAIKPGKPVAFGRVGDAGFFGLPGNPVSAFVTFCLFARPYLLRLAGRAEVEPTRRLIAAGFERRVSSTRREFLRARTEVGADGGERVRLFDHQGSHVLSSLAWANGLVELDPAAHIRPGNPVAFLPFSELLR